MYTHGKVFIKICLSARSYIFFTMPVLLSPATTHAQLVKAGKATAQNAYGGIAGSRSCRYSFVLQGKDLPLIQADSLWIGSHGTDLKDKNNCLLKPGYSGKMPTLTITTTVHMPNEYRLQPTFIKDSTTPTATPPVYRGVALLVYHRRGNRYTLTIPKITEWLPAVSYP